MPLDDAAVLVCVTEHLSVGDVFRLRAAFGARGARDWPEEVRLLVAQRLGLRRACKWSVLSRRMATRCVECGVRTGCRPRVCAACARDGVHPHRMLSRADVRVAWKGKRRLEYLLQYALVPAKRARTGAFVYWESDVARVLGSRTV